YLVSGVASLLGALGAVAVHPTGFLGFFYHPHMLAVVHLVTLGWVGGSVLGSIHLVGPLALRMPLRAARGDHAAFLVFALGVLGMASHFWLDSPRGMVYGAAAVSLVFARAALRILPRLRRSPLPWATKLPVALSFVNVVAAAGLGIALAVNKVTPFLPVRHLEGVFAHAHLAALGFATMIVVGAGARVLPMMLPSAMPSGRGIVTSALLLQAGTLGLVVAFFREGRGTRIAGLVAAVGVAVFLGEIVGMLCRPRRAPPDRPWPDTGAALSLLAIGYLAVATLLGLWLAHCSTPETALPLVPVYGALGLLGFLAQLIVGVQQRLLPMAAWLRGYARGGYAEMPPSLQAASNRPLQLVALAAWALGVPLLAGGLAVEGAAALRWGAALLFLGTLTHAASLGLTVRRLVAAPGKRT
ncbi:MAG TPA: hypothetical protein VIC87_15335, partial [Vicinamibacteria bacterium]